MKLSLCIATYNEEKNIHYPLDSAYHLADEVIIVDGGSTDKTVETAKSYGGKVKVFIEKNPAMFHINKQKAIDRASGEWILQLDADETLSDELKKEIKELFNYELRITDNQKKAMGVTKGRVPDSAQRFFQPAAGREHWREGISEQAPSPPFAFWIPRKNWFLSRFLMKGGQYPDYTIRLYKNGQAKFPCRDVHENVKVSGEVGYLKNPILHYADPTFSRYLMRWHRYNNLEAQLLVKSIKQSNNETMKQLSLLFQYLFWKPISTFFMIYIRHKGFLDGWPGFVFAFFSSIRFWEIYIKWRTLRQSQITNDK